MVTHDKYEAAPLHAYRGNFTDLGDTATAIRVALLGTSYTPDLTNHETWADVSADEIDPANHTVYTADGELINANGLARNGDTTTFDGDDVVWQDSTIIAYYAVVYDADSGYLLSLIDFEGEEESEEGDFSIEWDANGIFTVTANA